MDEIKRLFGQIGFAVAYGPEIDDDFHNFSALNFPKDHPARDCLLYTSPSPRDQRGSGMAGCG